MTCPFCEPRVANEPMVDSDDYCLVIDQENEILQGSVLIVPRAHREGPFDLTPEEIAFTFRLLRKVKSRLDSSLQPDGYNVGWNYKATAGQEVEHAHLHVIPRFKDEPLAGKGIRWALKQDSNRRVGA